MNQRSASRECRHPLWPSFGFRRDRRGRRLGAEVVDSAHHRPPINGVLILVPYGLTYFAMTYLLRVEEFAGMVGKLARFRR